VGPPGLPQAAKRVALSAHRILSAKEGHAMKRRINSLSQSLVLVRFGQELGTDSEIAQAIASGIDFLVSTVARFLS
jgi:hypothetical protein